MQRPKEGMVSRPAETNGYQFGHQTNQKKNHVILIDEASPLFGI